MYAARFENNLGLEPYQYEPRRAVHIVLIQILIHISLVRVKRKLILVIGE